MIFFKKNISKLVSQNETFFNGVFWVILGNLFSKGLSLLASIIVARFLGKFAFGEFEMIKSTLTLFGLFSTFGLGYAITTFSSRLTKTTPKKIFSLVSYSKKITLFTSVSCALLLIIFSNWLSIDTLEAPHLSSPLKIASIFIIFNAINVTQTGVLAGLKAFKTVALINFILGVVSFPIMIVSIILFGFYGAILGMVVCIIINYLLNNIFLIKEFKKQNIYKNESSFLEKREKKELLLYALPIALGEGFYAITSWGFNTFLIRLSDFGELGIYNAANLLASSILFIPVSLAPLILSFLSSAIIYKKDFKKMLILNIKLNIGITLILSLLSTIALPLIIKLYGKSYFGSESCFLILIWTTVLMALNNVYSQVFLSLKLAWGHFYLKIIRQSSIILFCIFFIPIYKALGLCISILFGHIINLIISILVVKYKLRRFSV